MKSRKNEQLNRHYQVLVSMKYGPKEISKLLPAYTKSGISPDDKEQTNQFFRFYLSGDPDMTVHKAKIYSELVKSSKQEEEQEEEQNIKKYKSEDYRKLSPKEATAAKWVLWISLIVFILGATVTSLLLFPPLISSVLLLVGVFVLMDALILGWFFESKLGRTEMEKMHLEISSIKAAEEFINSKGMADEAKVALKTLLAVREFRGGHASNKLSSSLKEFQKLLKNHQNKVLRGLTANETGDYLTYDGTNRRVLATELLNRVYDAELEAKIKGYKNLSLDRKAKVRSAYHTALFEQRLGQEEATRVAYNVKEGKSIHEAIFQSEPTFANWLASSNGAVLLTIASLPLLGIPALLKFKADSVSAVADKEEYFKGKGRMETTYEDEHLGADTGDNSDSSDDEQDINSEQFDNLNKKKKEKKDEEEEEEENDSENDDPSKLGQGK